MFLPMNLNTGLKKTICASLHGMSQKSGRVATKFFEFCWQSAYEKPPSTDVRSTEAMALCFIWGSMFWGSRLISTGAVDTGIVCMGTVGSVILVCS